MSEDREEPTEWEKGYDEGRRAFIEEMTEFLLDECSRAEFEYVHHRVSRAYELRKGADRD